MKDELKQRKNQEAIVKLAIFFFVFLGMEYMFDNQMAFVTDSAGVVLAQNVVLGVSAVGFLLYPLLQRVQYGEKGIFIRFAMVVSGMCCVFLIGQHTSCKSTLIAGVLLFLLLGILGSKIHCGAADAFRGGRHPAGCVGMAYAMGIFLQFLNNNLVNQESVEIVVLAVLFAVLLFMPESMQFFMRSAKEKNDGKTAKLEKTGKSNKESKQSREQKQAEKQKKKVNDTYEIRIESKEINENKLNYDLINKNTEQNLRFRNRKLAAGALAVTVALMTCIFATLDGAVTLVHASGSVDIGQWPRMLLAASGLAAGFLFDINNGRYMNLIMYCVTLLSTACVAVLELGGPFLAGLIVFYLSAGFFVVYFTGSFIKLSYEMKLPALWPGMGRAINNVFAIVASLPFLSFLLKENNMALMVTALVLFAGISVSSYIYSVQLVPAEREGATEQYSEEERFAAFVAAFHLSEREQEILKILLVSEENVQDIAGQLFLSRAALYRHLAGLYEKTGTRTRIGLLQFYYTWKGTKE